MAHCQSVFRPDDEFEDVVHKSDEEEDDILSAVAAMTQRDADLQSQFPKAAKAEAEEEAVGPSWSDLEAIHHLPAPILKFSHIEHVTPVLKTMEKITLSAPRTWDRTVTPRMLADCIISVRKSLWIAAACQLAA